jgi:transcriptional regulator with XRE-family HTH domain
MIKKKISAIDIEKITGLNRNTLYSIIAGTSKKPTAHNLQLIAKALNVSLDEILVDTKISQFQDFLSPEQMQAFSDATTHLVTTCLSKNIAFSLNKLTELIIEAYKYSLKTTPPTIDSKFIDWLLDKHQ